MIPFCDVAKLNAEVAPELASAFERVSRANSLILGPEVRAFEEEWAEYCGVAHAVGVGNGMDALTLMLRAFGIGAGDEVIVAPFGHVATWMAVSSVGAKPVGANTFSGSRNIDVYCAENAITDRTKAILATHLYGGRCDVAGLRDVADRRGVKLLFDACQAHGLKGADLGDAAAFSFYPTKNLGALGDGGAVATNDHAVATEVACLRNYGQSAKNVHGRVGVNSRLDELQAAFLRVKLHHLDEWNARRRLNAEAYFFWLDCEKPYLPDVLDAHVWHIFSIIVGARDTVRTLLHHRGIETAVHYPTPPFLQAPYRGTMQFGCPISEWLARSCISLPIGPEHSTDDVAKVSEAVNRATEELRLAA